MSWNCPESTHYSASLKRRFVRFWFRPYGQVLELRPISSSELGLPAYLVKLSSVQEATAARAALDGKPVMKGSPLVVRYWHGWEKKSLGVAGSSLWCYPRLEDLALVGLCWTLWELQTPERKNNNKRYILQTPEKTLIDISTKNHSWIIFANSAKKLGHHCSVKP